MIRVRYSPERLWLSVEGHARSGPFGQDLVCAAVSALTLTLWENLRVLEAEDKLQEVCRELDSGSACLSCLPKTPFRREAEGIFLTVTRGLACLARVYPRFLRCQRLTETE